MIARAVLFGVIGGVIGGAVAQWLIGHDLNLLVWLLLAALIVTLVGVIRYARRTY